MIARRLGDAPPGGFGMLSLKVFKNHRGEFDVLGFPLGFGKDDPIQRALRAFLKRVREERLGMAYKSDFTGGEAELLPD